MLACVYFYLQAGIYIYQLVDWYSSSLCMCLGGGLEFVAVAWYYGKFLKGPITFVVCTMYDVKMLFSLVSLSFFGIIRYLNTFLSNKLYNILNFLLVRVCESVYVVGAERFSRDMEMMLGYRAPIVLRICWCLISPSVFFVSHIMRFQRHGCLSKCLLYHK